MIITNIYIYIYIQENILNFAKGQPTFMKDIELFNNYDKKGNLPIIQTKHQWLIPHKPTLIKALSWGHYFNASGLYIDAKNNPKHYWPKDEKMYRPQNSIQYNISNIFHNVQNKTVIEDFGKKADIDWTPTTMAEFKRVCPHAYKKVQEYYWTHYRHNQTNFILGYSGCTNVQVN